MDPPQHTTFRRLVARGFTPRQVSALEPALRRDVRRRVERLVDTGRGDFVELLARPVPCFVVAQYLGVPASDRDRFEVWTEALVQAGAGGHEGGATGGAGRAVRVLQRPDRGATRRPGRGPHLRSGAPRPGRGRRRDRGHPRVRVRDGRGRQRHRDRACSAARPSCSPVIPSSGAGCSTTRPWSPPRSRSACASCRPCRACVGSRRATSTWAASRWPPGAGCCSATAAANRDPRVFGPDLRRVRRHPPHRAAPDVRQRRPFLPRRGGGAAAGPRRARGAASAPRRSSWWMPTRACSPTGRSPAGTCRCRARRALSGVGAAGACARRPSRNATLSWNSAGSSSGPSPIAP